MSLTFSDVEKDIILLGSPIIIRNNTDASGNILSTTTFYMNMNGTTYNSYYFNVVKERFSNGGTVDIKTLFTKNSTILQSTYPSLYNSYTSTSLSIPITSNTVYNVT